MAIFRRSEAGEAGVGAVKRGSRYAGDDQDQDAGQPPARHDRYRAAHGSAR